MTQTLLERPAEEHSGHQEDRTCLNSVPRLNGQNSLWDLEQELVPSASAPVMISWADNSQSSPRQTVGLGSLQECGGFNQQVDE